MLTLSPMLILVITFVCLFSANQFVLTRALMVKPNLRLPLIAGNWKMNTDLHTAGTLAKEVAELTSHVNPKDVEIAVFPPFPFLTEVKQRIANSSIKLGAQNCYHEPSGAFTGAVSAKMLASIGVHYSLLGHSERRKIFRESDDDINKSLHSVFSSGITPILCIGETKEEFQLGLNENVCTSQLTHGLKGVSNELAEKLVIAYEPVWAIGTGLTATPEIAQSVHATIRRWLSARFGDSIAQKIRILYGGSVTAETIDELMKCPDIDGALVGGASLVSKNFARIARYREFVPVEQAAK